MLFQQLFDVVGVLYANEPCVPTSGRWNDVRGKATQRTLHEESIFGEMMKDLYIYACDE